MTKHHQNNYFILTGAMGAGKSTVLKYLRERAVTCIDEPARQILSEQRAIQGDGVPDKNKKLFTDLLLSRSINQFNQMQAHSGSVIFDRGIPDNVCYAKLFELDVHVFVNASHQYGYNKSVFFLPAWEEIYVTDDERKMSFSEAQRFGQEIKKVYETLNYEVINVPAVSPQSRAEFILSMINR